MAKRFTTAKEVHNSFESPDSINAINWENKTKYINLFHYYKNLIALRKAHPAFHMNDAQQVRQYLTFLPTKSDHVINLYIK